MLEQSEKCGKHCLTRSLSGANETVFPRRQLPCRHREMPAPQVELAFSTPETPIRLQKFPIPLKSPLFLHPEIPFPQHGKLFPAAECMIWHVQPSRNDVEGTGMPRKAKDFAVKAERIADAWRRFFPTKTFSGLTLEQFRETFRPCREVRVELVQLATQRKTLLFRRRKFDLEGHPVLLRVVHAVRADPEVGEDSLMYNAMGYVPTYRRRKPGRKKKANASPRAAGAGTPVARQRKQRTRASSR